MRRIKLTVAYDGTQYCGWQVQPNGITVQEVLNKALTELLGVQTRTIGASRTDTGVHARGNVAVFDTESRMPASRIAFALNTYLPEDIRVQKSQEVSADFHPRFTSTVKTYEYKILNRTFPDPLRRLDSLFWYGGEQNTWRAPMISVDLPPLIFPRKIQSGRFMRQSSGKKKT